MSKNTIELNKDKVTTDNSKNSKEINWINDATSKNYLKYYEFNNFTNIQEIGSGNYSKVYRANWKNSHKCIVLKSFSSINSVTVKETLYEFKLQHMVDFHDNIRLYGITNLEMQNNKLNGFMLVMDYADGGTLQDYLKKHFNNLTWNDKLNMALQLAYAVSSMHEEGIVHCGLHSNKVFVHQNSIKIGDFGLSKRIEKESNQQSKLCQIIPYVDPKRFSLRNSNTLSSSNVKSDVYSVGVLLWVISSGHAPFNTDSEYDIGLAIEIAQGLRESPIPDTPSDFVKLYTECWDGEPDNRPTMQEVVRKLTTIILQKNVYQKFEKMNIKEIGTSTASNEPIMNKNIESENLLMIVDKTIDLINKSINGGNNEINIKETVINYITNNCKVILQEIYPWLLSNQNKSSNLTFLIGCFNYYGICINENHVQAFSLFSKAAEENNNLARYYVGLCHEFGEGALKSEEIAFQNYEEVANENYAAGEFKIGLFYDKGIGVKKSPEMATYWYKKAANNGNLTAQFNLAMIYKKEGDNKDYKKVFELFKQLAEKEYSRGISMLGYCYFNGIGTNVDNQRAFELYKKAANLGNSVAQYNLASMYESDVKDINQAIYWYKASACQGYPNARNRLESLNAGLQ